MVDSQAVRGVVVERVKDQFGPEMAWYVEQSMATDPESPFSRMILDAMLAQKAMSDGKPDEARRIIVGYRTIAASYGLEGMYDAMIEALGIAGAEDLPCQIDEPSGRAEGQYSSDLVRGD